MAIDDKLLNMAVKKGAPWWYAKVVFDNEISSDQLEYIEKNTTEEQNAKFMCKIFPEIANKIRYKYLRKKPDNSKDKDKFKNTFRTNLRINLERNGIVVKSLTTSMFEFILGYKFIDIVLHIESQFTKEMTWDNQGSFWHIDHIDPCSKLKYSSVHDKNFKHLWSLDNLRPLPAMDNILKNSKVVEINKKGFLWAERQQKLILT